VSETTRPLDPVDLLKDLERFESEALRTQDPTRKFLLLQKRAEVIELLVALMATAGFRCERLDRILATEPPVQALLETYTTYQNDELPKNLGPRPRDLRRPREDPGN
jgi:hypothetical protein